MDEANIVYLARKNIKLKRSNDKLDYEQVGPKDLGKKLRALAIRTPTFG